MFVTTWLLIEMDFVLSASSKKSYARKLPVSDYRTLDKVNSSVDTYIYT